MLMVSCDVDRFPETRITDPTFWRNESDLKSATNRLYAYLPKLLEDNDVWSNDVWSDDAYGTETNDISDGTLLVPGSNRTFNSLYRLVRTANVIIEKSALVIETGLEADKANIYVGEARFFRAWAYFNLLQRYGGVPLILNTVASDSPELYAKQASREEVLTAIYADLDFSANKLPLPGEMAGGNYGRISKTVALAFKSRVALFEGTRAKYHAYGNPEQHLNLAKQAALAVINSGQHDLHNSYYELFQYEGEGSSNPENILVRIYGKNIADNILSHKSQRKLEQGKVSPTKALADSYLLTDGLPMSKSPNYNVPSTIMEVFANRDPRMLHSFLKEGNEYIGTQLEFTIPSLSFQKTGFANRRYINPEDWNTQKSFIDYPIIRYAEVLLNYAEATFELDGSISDDDLNKSINELRSRPDVMMPSLTNSFATINNLDMKAEIRRERRVELALEGFRYWDLNRWKTAEIELPKPVLGNYYFAEFGTVVTPLLDGNGYILLQSGADREFDPAKNYLWPFPTEQLALNPSLIQNANW